MVTALALEVGVCAFNTSWVIPKTLKMVSVARCVPLPEWTGMGLNTGMDYRNGHLYVSWCKFHLVLNDIVA